MGVRSALGGIKHMGSNAAPGSCFRNLRHEFLFVRCEQPGEGEGLEFFVEPLFRDQFNIPQPTPSYSTLLASVPEEFVGTSSRLKPVVELLCGEVSTARRRAACSGTWSAGWCHMARTRASNVATVLFDSPRADGALL